MRISLSNAKVKFFIGNVPDLESIEPAMEGVNYVFQAAALKQVSSCEFYPLEAIKTNVLGTEPDPLVMKPAWGTSFLCQKPSGKIWVNLVLI